MTTLTCLKLPDRQKFKISNFDATEMLTKEKIRELKTEGNGAIGKLIKENKSSTPYLLNILENLGHLPDNFDGSWLPELLGSKSSQVRFWAVKNLGKLTDDDFLKTLKKVAIDDTDTNVRREAVPFAGSGTVGKTAKSLGRYFFLTEKDNYNFLFYYLDVPPSYARGRAFRYKSSRQRTKPTLRCGLSTSIPNAA